MSVIWFRHGLRIHDNPALLNAIQKAEENGGQIIPVFIFDGESAGTKLVGYNRMKFLLESLADLDYHFRSKGGQLYIINGSPTHIFRRLWEELAITSISFEQDCEPIWQARDYKVEALCRELGIECSEHVSHTLWNPREVIQTNGGNPPLTYQMFLHTIHVLGPASRPVHDPDFSRVSFMKLPSSLKTELALMTRLPVPEDFDIHRESGSAVAYLQWKGGELQALENLQTRLKSEEEAFKRGVYMPNQACPDLVGPPTSLSAHLRFGCLSVRRFYYAVHDLFERIKSTEMPSYCGLVGGPHITAQLIWREYFYTMSVTNPHYDKIDENPICLNIPWRLPNEDHLERWKTGQTGFPLVDAAMRQLMAEGWLHHTLRNAVATFLTRGGLWYSWEVGLEFFLKHLLDADWSVCAGNWMWISSSAFEKLLDSSKCTCPVALGRRLDPNGEYILRYIPELRNLPVKYIHQPWTTPLDIQERCECIIGVQYPEPMINLTAAGQANTKAMQKLRETLIGNNKSKEEIPVHCRPSNDEEICQFFWLTDEPILSN